MTSKCPVCGLAVIPDGPTAYLTLNEAMKIIGVGRTQAYDLARYFELTGGPFGIPCVRVTSQYRVPESALRHAVQHGLVRIPVQSSVERDPMRDRFGTDRTRELRQPDPS